APDGLPGVAGADQVPVLGHRVDEGAVGGAGVLELVDHHERKAGRDLPTYVGPLAEEPPELDHQVAAVQAPVLAQDPIMARVELRELPLAPSSLLLLGSGRLPLALLGPVPQPPRIDALRLQGVDSPQQPREQPRRVAADLVAPQ